MIELSAGSGIERIVSVAVVKVTCQSPFVSHRLEPADIQCSPVAINNGVFGGPPSISLCVSRI